MHSSAVDATDDADASPTAASTEHTSDATTTTGPSPTIVATVSATTSTAVAISPLRRRRVLVEWRFSTDTTASNAPAAEPASTVPPERTATTTISQG